METQTIHYFLSTIPQVLAAALAVLAAFLFLRFREITGLLIGDGKAIIRRHGQEGYTDFVGKYYLRMIDAVERENIQEVEEVLEYLSNKEIEKGTKKSDMPTGFQYVYEDRFLNTKKWLIFLKRFTYVAVTIILLIIVFSVCCLFYTDKIVELRSYSWLLLNLIFFIIAIILIVLMLIISQKQTIYENLKKRNNLISRNKNLS